MFKQYLKKEGAALTVLARYLLTKKIDDRLLTIDLLSDEFGYSVGYISKAFKLIEEQEAITLNKRGCNGTFIAFIDYEKLIGISDFDKLVCAMPLPYTKQYEGLASGLKQQIKKIPFYFAHMRGASIRAECLIAGIYDVAIMSKLTAAQFIKQGELQIAMELGPHSYVSEHRLICRKGNNLAIKRVAIDPTSPDQVLLTKMYFAEQNDIEFISVPYNEALQMIYKGEIDASIHNMFDVQLLTSLNLIDVSLVDNSQMTFQGCENAATAVLVIRNDAAHVKAILHYLIDKEQLLAHQTQVISGDIIPSY